MYGEAREDENLGESDGSSHQSSQPPLRRGSRTNILSEWAHCPPASSSATDPSMEDVLQLLRQLYILASEKSTAAAGWYSEEVYFWCYTKVLFFIKKSKLII